MFLRQIVNHLTTPTRSPKPGGQNINLHLFDNLKSSHFLLLLALTFSLGTFIVKFIVK
jgi:hypothetical protein